MSWRVEVSKDGELLVSIEDRMLTGKPEFTDEEAQMIRDCAEHLKAFIGPPVWRSTAIAPPVDDKERA